MALARGDLEREGKPKGIDDQVDLRGRSAARPSDALSRGPPRTRPAERSETTVAADSREERHSEGSSSEVGIVGIQPVAAAGWSSSRSVTIRESREKTVVITGATLEDLPLADQRSLMELAGAESVLTMRIVVGANYNVWTQAQVVEVMVKLSDARDGTMRWSARCTASSADYPSADAAIEGAARCVVAAITAP